MLSTGMAPRSAVFHRVPQDGETIYWKHAAWIAAAMIVFVAIRVHEVIPVLKAASPVMFVAIGGLAVLLYESHARVRTRPFNDKVVRYVVAYFVVGAVTIPFALWPRLAAETQQTFLVVVFLAIALLLCPPRGATQRMLQWTFVVASAGYGFYMSRTAEPDEYGRMTITSDSMYDPNDLAIICVIAAPLAVGLMLRSRGWRRILAFVAAAVCAYVITVTQSRGGAVSLAGAAFIYVFAFKGWNRVFGLVIIAALGAVLWSFAGPGFKQRMRTLLHLEEDYNTTAYVGRTQVWKRGLVYFKAHPVIGVGSANFSEAEGRFLLQRSKRGKWSAAHNTYLQVLVESGLVGASMFALILFHGFRRALALWRGLRIGGIMLQYPEYLAAFGGFMIGAMFLSHAFFPPFYALLGLLSLTYHTASVDAAAVRTAYGIPNSKNTMPSQRRAHQRMPAVS